ncbi:MAG TPA: hypothetical protein VGE90_11215, partial [Chitinophaga sp.]
MNMHPDDMVIQEYAQLRDITHEHIQQCPECQERVALYRQLFAALDREEIPEAAAHITDAVMARLPHKTMKVEYGWKILLGIILLMATGCIIGLLKFSGMVGWHFLPGANELALPALGTAGLAIFLVSLQWRHYRKT